MSLRAKTAVRGCPRGPLVQSTPCYERGGAGKLASRSRPKDPATASTCNSHPHPAPPPDRQAHGVQTRRQPNAHWTAPEGRLGGGAVSVTSRSSNLYAGRTPCSSGGPARPAAHGQQKPHRARPTVLPAVEWAAAQLLPGFLPQNGGDKHVYHRHVAARRPRPAWIRHGPPKCQAASFNST